MQFAVVDGWDGTLMAAVGLHLDRSHTRGTAELGFWCTAPARGRGVVTEASAAVVRWGFDVLGVERLQWYAEVGNAASRRVAEKLGFQLEGTLRAALVHDGWRVDAWVASLLPGELRKP